MTDIIWKGANAYIKVLGAERHIGFLNSDNNFVAFNFTGNYFRIYKGWALSEELIWELLDRQVNKIIIQIFKDRARKEMAKILAVTTDVFAEKGRKIKEPGFENQLVLSEANFDKIMEVE